jgi:hypothetical protein
MAKNKLNFDGSINSFQITGKPGHGYSVPFNSDDFDKEIEPNILDAVLILNNKGYRTVTSCQGHSKYDYYFNNAIRYNDGPQVTVSFLKNVYLPNTFFVMTTENKSINDDRYFHVSIRIKPWIGKFFTNKFLCSILTKYCEDLPSVYSIN